MDKIGIITHYNVHNYGAELQLYALRKTLGKLGYEANALQYTKNYDFIDHKIAAKYSISLKSVPIYIKYMLCNGFARTIYNFRKKRLLNSFEKNQQQLGEYYADAKDLYAVVIGSDEIFSVEAGPNPWFWGFGVPCDKILSYAASFGPTKMDDIESHHVKELVQAGIQHIDQLAVRDKNSADIIAELSGRQVEIVCDPVLLYGFPKEMQNKSGKITQKDYVIVYSYDDHMNDKETVNAIRQYAYDHGCEVISVGYYHKWCDRNLLVDVLDIFIVFKNAKLVFTDTFHGTVFSILTNAQFWAKITTNSNKLGFLLEQYDLKNRSVGSFGDVVSREDRIDYRIINEITEKMRSKSFNYLANALGGTDVT